MQHRPQSANTDKWCDVSIQQGQVTIKGGFNRKGELADAIHYKCADNATYTFLALHKEALWFVKGAGASRKGDLKAVQVLNMLREKVASQDTAHCPAVAGPDSQSSATSAADAVDEDPMDAMISKEYVAASLVEHVKQQPKKRKVDRACVQELTVPTRPPCVGTASLGETKIFVYASQDKRRNAVLHLRADCISWLLSYAADELACQGVSRGDANSDTTPQKPNCSGVDDVYLEWDFALKRWDAIFLAGTARGEAIQFGADDVTPALHTKLRELDLANGLHSKTSVSNKKLAAKEYVTLWCKAIAENKLHEFNTVFQGLLEAAPETHANADVAESTADGDAAENADGAVLAAGDTSAEEVSDAEAAELGAGNA